ncbi:hypothetical protein IAU60_003751 [Kwoniella sp. DSM 27419]
MLKRLLSTHPRPPPDHIKLEPRRPALDRPTAQHHQQGYTSYPAHQPASPYRETPRTDPQPRSYPDVSPYSPARTRPIGSQKQLKKQRSGRRCAPSWRRLRSVLYHGTFWLFVVIIAVLLVGSAWGLGEQSWRTGDRRSWNLIVLVAAYVVLGFISITHVWSRILSIKKILRTMPKPYMPTKTVDVPKRVAEHIGIEYSRTAVIAHISQATTGQQEGWGRPGTKWEDKHFRSYILSTLPVLRQALCPDDLAPPLSLRPLLDAADKVDDKGALRLFVNSYARIIESAKFGRREPSQADAEAVEKVVEVVLLTLEVKRRRERGKEDVFRHDQVKG